MSFVIRWGTHGGAGLLVLSHDQGAVPPAGRRDQGAARRGRRQTGAAGPRPLTGQKPISPPPSTVVVGFLRIPAAGGTPERAPRSRPGRIFARESVSGLGRGAPGARQLIARSMRRTGRGRAVSSTAAAAAMERRVPALAHGAACGDGGQRCVQARGSLPPSRACAQSRARTAA